ncbi:MAG: PACE efflux transporter [Proteobacteria bacterium]|nr:PACE efflux transporter [Pseudomonadota bacterium]HQR05079.1 PACE efflux transporter [Rhodocyclaceae bacterium]
MPHPAVPLRSFADRARQVVLFEILGLILITPLFSWASGHPLDSAAGLLAVLSLVAAIWNGAYSTSVDWLQARLFGQRADQRGFLARGLHALMFETGLLVLTLPIIVAWTKMSWWPALMADLGLACAYTIYAFVFNLAYDRRFPIAPHGRHETP